MVEGALLLVYAVISGSILRRIYSDLLGPTAKRLGVRLRDRLLPEPTAGKAVKQSNDQTKANNTKKKPKARAR